MGYYNQGNSFWPDDTDECFYIEAGATMSYIKERATEKWGSAFSDLGITSQYIHTTCIHYDLHDSGDYTDFLCITRIQ